MREPTFIYRGKLPGFNVYQNLNRASFHQANALKQKTEADIRRQMILYGLRLREVPRFRGAVRIRLVWHEPPSKKGGKRRDLDNIVFAKKFLLDAMKGYVMHDDSLEYVREIADVVLLEGQGEDFGVEVFIEDWEG